MYLLAEKDSASSLEKVLSRSVTFEASDVVNSAKNNFSECVKVEALRNCIEKRWSPFICIMALSNVVGLPILSIYPDSGDEFAVLLSNATLYPRGKTCENSATLNLFWSVSTDLKGSTSFRPNQIVPVVAINNGDVQANVHKIHQAKIAFPKLRIKYSSLSSSICEIVSDNSREEIITPLNLDSCSQEAPYYRPDEIASGKFKYDIGCFYNKVDRLSSHEKYDIVHSVWAPSSEFNFQCTVKSGKNRKFQYKKA